MSTYNHKLQRNYNAIINPKLEVVLIFILAISICTGVAAQEDTKDEYPRTRMGLNLGFKSNNPGLQKSDINYIGSVEINDGGSFSYIHYFMANRIGKGWYINSGLNFMTSETHVSATYTIDKLSHERKLGGQLTQSTLTFSWKIEYWLGKYLYFNTGPAANMLFRNTYENRIRKSPSYGVESDWVSGKDFFWGWQSNIGGRIPFEAFALQGNFGYLWGEQVGDPNLIHHLFSFCLGFVAEF